MRLAMKTYSAIQFILEIIESNLNNKLSIEYLAKKSGISKIHLQRVFMMAFKIPLAKYIRLRKLSASLNKLAFSDSKIIDIAYELGFEHEQSFIRAFKREYGITPWQYKDKGAIIKVTPPFTMDDFINISNGILSMPDIVIIPEMYLMGEVHLISWEETMEKSPRVAIEFWENNRQKINNPINKNIYIGLTRWPDEKRSIYLPSIQVTNIDEVPEGLTGDKLPPAEYFRFFYIGNHHPYNLNIRVLDEMWRAINQ